MANSLKPDRTGSAPRASSSSPAATRPGPPIISHEMLHWDADRLRIGKRGRVVASIVPDPDFPELCRIHLPDGSVGDLVNRSRARDAAKSIAFAEINRRP